MTVNVQKKRRYRIAAVSRKPSSETPRRSAKSSRLYTLLTLITGAGVFMGAYAFAAYGGGDIAELISAQVGKGFLKSFSDSALIIMAYVMICFFGGFSSVGKPAAYILCVFKGMGAGFLSACLFSGGASSANLAEMLDILPFEAMSIAVVIFSARENIRLSDLTANRTFGGSSAEDSSAGSADIGLYLKKFAVITAAAVLSAALDGIISIITQMM